MLYWVLFGEWGKKRRIQENQIPIAGAHFPMPAGTHTGVLFDLVTGAGGNGSPPGCSYKSPVEYFKFQRPLPSLLGYFQYSGLQESDEIPLYSS
ncbi:hypothetical protein AAC387_Pa09g1130 [Persea americana]